LNSSPDRSNEQIKWRRIRWAGQVARIGEERKVYKVYYSKDRGVDVRIGSEWILARLAGVCGVDSVVSGYRLVKGPFEHDAEPSGSVTTELVS
jgi:hypothetical protein